MDVQGTSEGAKSAMYMPFILDERTNGDGNVVRLCHMCLKLSPHNVPRLLAPLRSKQTA